MQEKSRGSQCGHVTPHANMGIMNGLSSVCVTPVTRPYSGNVPHSSSMLRVTRQKHDRSGKDSMYDGSEAVRVMVGLSAQSNGEERLATAVILQAVRDCSSVHVVQIPERGKDGAPLFTITGCPKTHGQRTYHDNGREGQLAMSARDFLSKSNSALSFWCSILQVHPDHIHDAYFKTIRPL